MNNELEMAKEVVERFKTDNIPLEEAIEIVKAMWEVKENELCK